MIANFKDTPMRPTGVIYQSALQQIKMLHEKDPLLAGELAESIIELTLTGDTSTDDFTILLALENLRNVVKNNQEKYDKTREAKQQNKIQEYKLDIIAAMLQQGKSQVEIAKELGVNKQTINYRINNMIKPHYPELLQQQSNENFDQGCGRSKKFFDEDAMSKVNFFDWSSNESKKSDEILKNSFDSCSNQSKKSDESNKNSFDSTLDRSKSQISQIDVNVNVNDDFLTCGQIIYKTISPQQCKAMPQKEIVDASQGIIKDLTTGEIFRVVTLPG